MTYKIRLPEEIRRRAGLEPGIYSIQYVMDRISETDPEHSHLWRGRQKCQRPESIERGTQADMEEKA
ncbi:hypothetical protein [Methanocalculus natronophilus]|uniref:hypothetical protein n=1 Tax=Methanocalculus natronophilus TaxID=1262400 RepID=UPI0031B5BC1F